MTVTIEIFGANSIIKGDYPLQQVRQATSYPVEGARFSKAFKKGLWDGRKHLLKKKSGAFPTGLLEIVKNTCKEAGIDPYVIDKREDPGYGGLYPGSFDLNEAFILRDYQLEACEKVIENKQGIIKVGTGGGKTIISAAIINYLQLPTLFIVTTRELLYQAKKRFLQAIPNLTEQDIGLVGDGNWEPGRWITVAVIDTLAQRLNETECRRLVENVDVLFLDECHKVGSESFFDVATFCNAYYRIGMSGTPLDRTDGANLRLIAATGPLLTDINTKLLMEKGVVAKAAILWDKVTTPVLPTKIQYKTAYKQGVVENKTLLGKVVEWTKICSRNNLSVLILIDEIAHGNNVDDALWTQTGEQFVPHQFIHGQESSDVRSQALQDFEDRRLPVLIASTILDEGVDLSSIDVLICAGSKKSKIRTMQRIGRGLRGEKLIVVEFANFTNKYLQEHSLKRYKDYKSEDCFLLKQSPPDEDLVKELWNSL